MGIKCRHSKGTDYEQLDHQWSHNDQVHRISYGLYYSNWTITMAIQVAMTLYMYMLLYMLVAMAMTDYQRWLSSYILHNKLQVQAFWSFRPSQVQCALCIPYLISWRVSVLIKLLASFQYQLGVAWNENFFELWPQLTVWERRCYWLVSKRTYDCTVENSCY